MKTMLVSMIFVCLVIGCSKSTLTNAASNPAQFYFTANDLASLAEVATNQAGTIVVRFKPTKPKAVTLQAFTRTHFNLKATPN